MFLDLLTHFFENLVQTDFIFYFAGLIVFLMVTYVVKVLFNATA